ncbi:GNAT family N-acetyltransferase [Psychromonas sp. SP041]|uniref:GNAT family N-acetyltransferase n=1 Tax=Psychromonas sp. SP041 TaxID=1365007 RepID=UPI00041DBE28|nr:GNAT family N-acetyltransferase [Psychromonas sp. SP041]
MSDITGTTDIAAMTTITTITTARLILRPFQSNDFEKAYQLFSDPIVMRFSLNGPYSAEKCQIFIDQCMLKSKNNEPSLLAVIDKQTNQLIGSCGFFAQTIQGMAELELGYRLLPHYWGKGLATEAAMAMKSYAFNEMGLTRLISLIETDNIASISVAEKNDFKLEKTMLYDGRISVGMYVAIR